MTSALSMASCEMVLDDDLLTLSTHHYESLLIEKGMAEAGSSVEVCHNYYCLQVVLLIEGHLFS